MSIIKHITLQKIVARDFRYIPRILNNGITKQKCIVGGFFFSYLICNYAVSGVNCVASNINLIMNIIDKGLD